MGNAINNITERVRVFFRYISWKKILTFSFFVIIATILWFMQIYNQYFETTVTVPIKYESIPDSIVFQDSLPTEISIRLKDDGFAMFKYAFRHKDTLRLDVSSIIKNNTSKVLQGAAFDQYIRNTVSLSSQVLNYEPVRITFSYSPLKHKKIPVIFDGNINLSPGYLLNGDIKVMPDSVYVYGSSIDLNKIVYVYTAKDTIGGIESTKTVPINLLPIHNIKIVPQKVDINIPVEAYIQKKIEVPVECLNLPENLTVKFFPSKVNLSFFVGVSKSDSIKEQDFTVTVDYDGLKESNSPSIPVRITSSPEYVRNLTITPPNVEFIFEHKNQYND
jgi:hypothetical protein